MRACLVLLGVLMGLWGTIPGVALGHEATPPPPPTLTTCVPCSPPPPPAPVPTVPPGALPPVTAVVSVSVHLSPAQIHRGRWATLSISSTPKAPVVVLVRYKGDKPWRRSARVNATGKLRLYWKVPATAPLGHATVTVQVKHNPKPYTAVVPFTVLP